MAQRSIAHTPMHDRGAAKSVALAVAVLFLASGSVNASATALATGVGTAHPGPAARRAIGSQSGPDLVVTRVARTAVLGDWQTLDITGSLAIDVGNVGDGPAGRFDVTVFEDRDADGRYDPGLDLELGRAAVAALGSGAETSLDVAVAGKTAFRDNLLYALADSGSAIGEADESNNLRHTGDECAFVPSAGAFDPALEWAWLGSNTEKHSRQVMMAPVVVDLTDDGVPEIIFSTFMSVYYEADGHLRAIDGRDGTELFTLSRASHAVKGASAVAVGDIDGDDRPEIVAVHETGMSLLAFEHDGVHKWSSRRIPNVRWGGAAIADLDRDGEPEIVAGATVLNADGTIRWSAAEEGDPLGRGDNGKGPLSIVADVDLAGPQEVVAGNTVYRADGSVLWHRDDLTDGFNAVGNFDDDEFPEIVLVTRGTVHLLEHDGASVWGPVDLPPGGPRRNSGGPPTIADVDSDGEPEIGVAGGYAYTVFETDSTLKWRRGTDDYSSSRTGSSVFDFEGDGAAEVIYGDENALRIFRGSDGSTLWEIERPSGTTYELPVVADVDADGNAEILAVCNDYRSEPGSAGIYVFGDTADTWVATRRIWNQHSYHVGNVRDDGTIPMVEEPSWLDHNTYRLNLPVGLDPHAAPDLTASLIEVETSGYPDAATVAARIGNGGAILAPTGVPVAFYADAGGSLRLLGVASLPGPLEPGQWVRLAVDWSPPLPDSSLIVVAADDDGTGAGTTNECDETNNVHRLMVVLQPSPTPTSSVSPTPSHTPTPSATPIRTHTPSRTPSFTPTASATSSSTPMPPRRLYLPLLLNEVPIVRTKHADVVLVLDASSSMTGEKVAAAKAAALAFVHQTELPRDQVAIVAFNQEAQLLTGLTGDLGFIESAIARIQTRQGTRIDKGLDAARRALAGVGRIYANTPVIVLLTDGRQYEEPPAAQLVADRLLSEDVTIYSIGLGADVDREFLTQLAGDPTRYFFAPEPEDLAGIYGSIALRIPCVPGDYWGRRCP